MPDAPKDAAAEKPRSVWLKILTSTPVIMTVVATLLAGLSNSEMTKAQYYRSLAAQYQSKVSDQWNFFQAKRIRGTTMEMTIRLVQSLSDPGDLRGAALQVRADRLPGDLKRADAEADRLVAAAAALPSESRLKSAAAELKKTTAALVTPAEQSRDKLKALLGDEKTLSGIEYLGSNRLPGKEGETADPRKALTEVFTGINPVIVDGLREIADRKTEGQMKETLKLITAEQIQQAIDEAEARAAEVDRLGDEVGATHRSLGGWVTAQANLMRQYHRAAREASLAAAALPPGDSKELTEARLAAAAVQRTDVELKGDADELANDFKAAQIDYNVRRYDREARFNQSIASLYDPQVRKAGLESERHRTRSGNFFFAMLAAQAGVTIATFALAVRFGSVLWGLAALAGLTAMGFGVYIFLVM